MRKIFLVKLFISFLVFFVSTSKVFAQDSSIYSEACDSSHIAKPGTYEIVLINGSTEKSSPITTNLPIFTLCEIEKMRKETKTVEYMFNNCTMIRIYPRIHQPKTTSTK